jgi:AcrR family transcriptional regulator
VFATRIRETRAKGVLMAAKPKTVPRKRPRQERSRATIAAILTATARILEHDGFDRASTNRIAAAAGVSVGSLYQYFPSKEALVAALIERHMEEMTSEIVAGLDRVAKLPLTEAVRQMVELMLRAHAVDPKLHRVLIEQVPRIGRMGKLREVERQVFKVVRAYLEVQRAELRVTDLDLAAFVVVQTVEALTHGFVLYHPQKLSEPALRDEITDLVVRYLAC